MSRPKPAARNQPDPLATLSKFRIIIRAAQRHSAAIQKQCGVSGAQFGARAGQKIRGEHLRLLLGLLVLAVGIRFAVELVIRPEDLFTIRETGVTG